MDQPPQDSQAQDSQTQDGWPADGSTVGDDGGRLPARPSGGGRQRNPAFESVMTTLDWILVAFILALTFRAFVMEAFRIPTGSMAETLRGDHYPVRCLQCGYRFDVGNDSYGSLPPQCPSCGAGLPEQPPVPVANGDRILVLKMLYQFVEPQRWDVVVFKNPVDPRENYIKRMIGLPGETVQIIDGDIYIDGRIVRKPPRVQEELFMPVFLCDYQDPDRWGAGAIEERYDGPGFVNEPGSAWDVGVTTPAVLSLEADAETVHVLGFEPGPLGYKVKYGYNGHMMNRAQPTCSDLMVQFDVLGRGSGDARGQIGAELGKYGRRYRGTVYADGRMTLEQVRGGQAILLTETQGKPIANGRARRFRLANVDHRLVLAWAGQRLRYDLGSEPGALGNPRRGMQPSVRVFGSGRVQLLHAGVWRDTYYTSAGSLRAVQEPFALGEGEYFVCGDNSPNSLDARMWNRPGKGNSGQVYREGVVPRDFLMGKAFMVYWADAFRISPQHQLALIPNISEIKVVHGGSPGEF